MLALAQDNYISWAAIPGVGSSNCVSAPVFSQDGTKLFCSVSESGSAYAYRLDLSAPWDTSTAVFHSKTALSRSSNWREHIYIDPTGIFIVFLFNTTKQVHTLSAPWTLPVSAVIYETSVGSTAGFSGLTFSPDGLKCIVADEYNGNNIQEFTLSSPWDVTSVVSTDYLYWRDQVVPPTWESFQPYPHSCTCSCDGAYLVVAAHHTVSHFWVFKLSTPWDILTALYTETYSADLLLTNGGCFSNVLNNKMPCLDNSTIFSFAVTGLCEEALFWTGFKGQTESS